MMPQLVCMRFISLEASGFAALGAQAAPFLSPIYSMRAEVADTSPALYGLCPPPQPLLPDHTCVT